MAYPFSIGGRKFLFEVSYDGTFHSTVDGERIEAKSLDALKLAVKKEITVPREKLSIPVTQIDSFWSTSVLAHGIITGVHSRTKKFLVQWETGTDKGRTTQESNAHLYTRFSKQDEAQLKQLNNAIEQAENEKQKFLKARHITTKIKEPKE